ncbi:type III secretion system export apparatus subunit SctR [Chitinivorax sp. B]|uniref:type III secretion system export apparatus subunit SctR n=1 Tax=Chitinivorax sp. B TaxID=2502235 RepID=UPI0010F8555E|nr:type III secretion system export apparatus subunit SctR [Chitinivorax sp. B]
MSGLTADPFSLLVLLAMMALLPLLLMVTTCFLKISVVLLMVRNALGVQQAPPTLALYGIAMAMTLFVMSPVLTRMANQFHQDSPQAAMTSQVTLERVKLAAAPLRDFMQRYVRPEQATHFLASARKLWPKAEGDAASKQDLLILVPAFVVSELQTAFEISFLLYLPFVVIDLVISNLLMALGMQMVSPSTISLPLKILLFVMLDGWSKLLHGLALSYV